MDYVKFIEEVLHIVMYKFRRREENYLKIIFDYAQSRRGLSLI